MIFAHFFIFLLFVHYVNSKEVLKIGFLKHPKYPQVLGAISLAVQKINNDSNILPKTKLEFSFGKVLLVLQIIFFKSFPREYRHKG